MSAALRFTRPNSLITGWDFSTGAVKCLAFELDGTAVAEVRLPTDLWLGEPGSGVSELNLLQLEGQARASTRAMAARLKELGRLGDWVAGGISATHHTSGRIDASRVQVRRAICWNDQTLAEYRRLGEERLGGPQRVLELIGGPWADRYSLSHLVKDEATLSRADWQRTWRVLSHGALSAGFLTGNFDVTSISTAASTGIMDLRTGQWRREMLGALASPELQELAWQQLPKIVDHFEPLGPLAPHVCLECGLTGTPPLLFPTSDDQQAGLVGGGAVNEGQMAIVLGNSAVVNSSSRTLLSSGLDVMKLNWGPNLWMRCYNNGAWFLNVLFGEKANWTELEWLARAVHAGSNGCLIAPFVSSEPSLGIRKPWLEFSPREPRDMGEKFRAALESLAYLIERGVRAHEEAGQNVTKITVSGGISHNALMCEILASVLDRPITRLQASEGPAQGAAATALAAWETRLRRQQGESEPFTVADAVAAMVRDGQTFAPNPAWRGVYAERRRTFADWIASHAS